MYDIFKKQNPNFISSFSFCAFANKLSNIFLLFYVSYFSIKIHEASNFQEVSAVMSVEREISIENIAWTDDGQLLTAAGASGSVYVFLSRLPQLAGVSSEFIATLSSLKSISLYLCKYENMKV